MSGLTCSHCSFVFVLCIFDWIDFDVERVAVLAWPNRSHVCSCGSVFLCVAEFAGAWFCVLGESDKECFLLFAAAP